MALKLLAVPLKVVKKAAQAVRDGGRAHPAPVPRGRKRDEGDGRDERRESGEP